MATANGFEYDALDRLYARNGTSFSYDDDSQNFVSDGEYNYVRTPYGAPVSVQQGSTNLAMLSDLHGDVVGTFDPTGSVTSSTTAYDPWGKTESSTGFQSSVGYQGSWTNPASSNERTWSQSRWYSPTSGNFASRDSFDVPLSSSVSSNRYTYGNANPMTFSDPSGRMGTITWNPPSLGDVADEVWDEVKDGVKDGVGKIKTGIKNGVRTIGKKAIIGTVLVGGVLLILLEDGTYVDPNTVELDLQTLPFIESIQDWVPTPGPGSPLPPCKTNCGGPEKQLPPPWKPEPKGPIQTPEDLLVDLDADFDVADIFEFSDSLPVQLAQDLFLGNIPFTNDNASDNENCASTGTCFNGDTTVRNAIPDKGVTNDELFRLFHPDEDMDCSSSGQRLPDGTYILGSQDTIACSSVSGGTESGSGAESNRLSGRKRVGTGLDPAVRNMENFSKRNPMDGYFDVIGHGLPNEIEGMSADELADLLRKENSGWNGQNVRLLSCWTACPSGSFAQDLANNLGVDVVAPTTEIEASSRGKTLIFYDGGEWRRASPN
jgi:RHS repeat-associated protein